MATDREIKGIPIKTYAGDAPSFGRGDIWYNSVTDKLRTSAVYGAAGTWASGGTTPIGLSANGISVGTNNLTVGRNGHNIQGAAADLTLAIDDQAITLVYVDSTQGWLIKG